MARDHRNIVLNWLEKLANEIAEVIKSDMSAKSHIMLLMVYIDVFSQVWNLASKNPVQKNNKIVKAWLKKFFVKESDDYLNTVGNADEHTLYKIRCSLLHFASLPNIQQPYYISEYSKQSFLEKYPKLAQQSSYTSHDIIVLHPNTMYKLAFEAFINTLKIIESIYPENSKQNDELYQKLHSKLKEEICIPIAEK